MNARALVSRTALYGFSILLMRGVSLFMLPFVASHLSQRDFGELELLTSVAVFGSVIIGLGLEDALYRFSGLASDPQEKMRLAGLIYGLALLGSAALFGLSLIAVYIYGNSDVIIFSRDALLVVLITVAVEGPIAIPMGWIRMHDRATLYCALNLGRCALQALLVWAFVMHGLGVMGVLVAGAIAAVASAVVLFFVMRNNAHIALHWAKSQRILRYSFPLVGSGLLAFLLGGFDRWIVGLKFSLVDLACYGIAAKFALVLVIAMQPFGMWLSPIRFQLLSDVGGIRKLSILSNLGIAGVIVNLFGLGYFAPWIISVLLPVEYQAAIVLLPLALSAAALKEITELSSVGTLYKDSTVAQLKINVMSTVVGVLMMMGFAAMLGMQGVLLGLFVAQLLRSVLLFRVAQSNIFLQLPMRKFSIIFVLVLLMITQHTVSLEAPIYFTSLLLNFFTSAMLVLLVSLLIFFDDYKKVLRSLPRLVRI